MSSSSAPPNSVGEPTLRAGDAASGSTGSEQRPPLEQTALAAAVQAERRRIAQALHDTVSQTLTAAYLQALVTARKLTASGSEAADEVAHLTELIHQGVVELQTVARQLQPENECAVE